MIKTRKNPSLRPTTTRIVRRCRFPIGIATRHGLALLAGSDCIVSGPPTHVCFQRFRVVLRGQSKIPTVSNPVIAAVMIAGTGWIGRHGGAGAPSGQVFGYSW